MPKTLISGPTQEPLNLQEVKCYLRLAADPLSADQYTSEDALLSTHLMAARAHVENITGLKLVTQVWDVYYDAWYDEFVLPVQPVQSVEIFYTDDEDTETELESNYILDSICIPPVVVIEEEPTATLADRNPIRIRVTAGYELPNDIPEPIRQAMYTVIQGLYETGEISAGVTQTVKALTEHYNSLEFLQ